MQNLIANVSILHTEASSESPNPGVWVWRISGFYGYGGSVGISTGFSVGMGMGI